MKIQKLSNEVINQIAAGEVVERPASVVKELVENALDAGASKIIVSLKDGGKRSIEVSDDGEGIAREDLALVFERHATSKLKVLDDLSKIISFGFRGEALSSVAAVSDCIVASRHKDADFGFVLRSSFGEIGGIEKVGRAIGTVVRVNDLFLQVPARQKFLKSASTERKHIVRELSAFALANHTISFVLKDNGKEIFHFLKKDTVADRIDEVLGSGVKGKLVEVLFNHPHVKVSGSVGTPEIGSTNAGQWLFVNKRSVEDSAVFAAVRAGFGGLLPPKARPTFVLFIDMPAHLVDVNVHPRKKEVRFQVASFIFNAVKDAVKQALGSVDLTPWDMKPTVSADRYSSRLDERVVPFVQKNHKVVAQGNAARELPYGSRYDYPRPAQGDAILPSFLQDAQPVTIREAGTEDFFVFDNVYIFVKEGGGITVYDQHALHERIIFDRLVRNFQTDLQEVGKQYLLIPLEVVLSPSEYEIFANFKEFIIKVGFELEEKGDRKLILTGYPQGLDEGAVRHFLQGAIEDWSKGDFLEAKKEIALATIACRSAVKAGDRLSQQEIQKLLEDIVTLDEKYTCPHGRPFKVHLTRGQIDKWFMRV